MAALTSGTPLRPVVVDSIYLLRRNQPLESGWASSMTKNDITAMCMLGIGSVAVGFGWARNIWGKGAEKTYERMNKAGNTWVVLKFLKIEPTRDNCIRFLKIASAVGLFVAIPFAAASIIHTILTK
jgi:hypothetical protein